MIIYSNIENVNSKTASCGKKFPEHGLLQLLGTSGSETGTQKKQGFLC